MRSKSHMNVLASVAIAAAFADIPGSPMLPKAHGPAPAEPPEPAPTRKAILDTGKPPMNGAREVARRQRQMARAAAKKEGA